MIQHTACNYWHSLLVMQIIHNYSDFIHANGSARFKVAILKYIFIDCFNWNKLVFWRREIQYLSNVTASLSLLTQRQKWIRFSLQLHMHVAFYFCTNICAFWITFSCYKLPAHITACLSLVWDMCCIIKTIGSHVTNLRYILYAHFCTNGCKW